MELEKIKGWLIPVFFYGFFTLIPLSSLAELKS